MTDLKGKKRSPEDYRAYDSYLRCESIRCLKCDMYRPIEDFYANVKGFHNRCSYCKRCDREMHQEQHKKPEVRARHNERCREYAASHREQIRAASARWYAGNAEKLLAKSRRQQKWKTPHSRRYQLQWRRSIEGRIRRMMWEVERTCFCKLDVEQAVIKWSTDPAFLALHRKWGKSRYSRHLAPTLYWDEHEDISLDYLKLMSAGEKRSILSKQIVAMRIERREREAREANEVRA